MWQRFELRKLTFEAEIIIFVIKNVQTLILTTIEIQLIENVPNDDYDEMYETFFRSMAKLTPQIFYYMQILPNFTPKCTPLSNTLDEKVADFAFSSFSLISTVCLGPEKL